MKHKGLLLAVALLLVGVCATAVQCATIYVNGATGNNSNNGLSWGAAKKTVAAGLTTAASGDELWVARGTYPERITLREAVALYGGFAGTETLRSQRNWTTNVTVLDGTQGGTVVTAPSGLTLLATIDGFTVRNGRASSGAGIKCTSSSPTIANNTIVSNATTSGSGAGIYCASSSSPAITNNTISYNSVSGGSGGGIYCATSSSPVIAHNTITGNYANSGGGISCYSTSPTISNNTVTGNSVSGSGGGIYCESSASAINNNIIVNNLANNGGGINSASSLSLAITNNSITGNTASADHGGGVSCAGGTAAISSNIIAFNSSGIYYYLGSPTLRNNCVYNPSGMNYKSVSPGTGDISVDPRLVAVDYVKLHIQPDSPCIDTGYDASVGLDWSDMDGQARLQGTHVDIGADESDGTTWVYNATVVRVKPTGSDSNNGSSWALAKRTVQAAIDTAAQAGGEVWVAAATYVGTITLKPYVYLYGGFGGAETTRDQRDSGSNATTLDGNQSGPVVTISCGYQNARIDGFRVMNGKVTAGSAGISCSGSPFVSNNVIVGNSSSVGGGVSCSSFAVVTNNVITGNSATQSGGGISCTGSPAISNNTIRGNSVSVSGGGIYTSGGSPLITNNTIVSCYAAGYPSALDCNSYSTAAITNNIVAFCSAGIRKDNTSTPTLRNNCVYNPDGANYTSLSAGTGDISVDPLLAALDYGQVHIQPASPCIDAGYDAAVGSGWTDMDGQIRLQGTHVDIGADESAGTSWTYTPAVIRVTPSGNDANDGSSWELSKRTIQVAVDAISLIGGEVWVAAGTYAERITLKPYVYLYGGFAAKETSRDQRRFRNNVTTLNGSSAGSVVTAVGGYHSSCIDGFTITNGRAGSGAGIFSSVASPYISHNLITGNASTSTGGGGGGVYCYHGSPVIASNAIVANSAISYAAAIYTQGSTAIIVNNTITGNSSGTGKCSIELQDGFPVVSNNIVAFNSSGIEKTTFTLTLRNNCVYNPAGVNYFPGLSAGTGDISVDPLFVDSANSNYHLKTTSPCIDVGYNSASGLPSLDMDGEARILDGTVDIGADEFSRRLLDISAAKGDANGSPEWGYGAVVTAAFPDFFYVQTDDRSTGIGGKGPTGLRVKKTGHGLAKGMKADIWGSMVTDTNGEHCLNASSVAQDGSGTLLGPLALNNKAIGGGNLSFNSITGAGQQGIVGAAGLNNIGLLVRTTGKFTYVDATTFLIDDGSGVNVKCTVPGTVTLNPSWTFVEVTGISSCEKTGDDLNPVILVREQTDITAM